MVWRIPKPVVYTGFHGYGGGLHGAMGRDFFTLEKSKISRFCKLENFQIMLKGQRKIDSFLENLKEFFWKFFKNLSKYSRKFMRKFK